MDRQADEDRQALAEFHDRVAMHAVMQPGAYLRNITALPARNLDPEFAAAALEYDRECEAERGRCLARVAHEYDARDRSDPDAAGSATPSLCFARGLGPRHTEGGSCAEGDATPTLLPRLGACPPECDAEGDATPTLLPRLGACPPECDAEGDATPTLLPRPFSACWQWVGVEGDATPTLLPRLGACSPGTLAERFAHGAALSERCAESCIEPPPPLTTIPGYTENEAPELASSAVEYEEQD